MTPTPSEGPQKASQSPDRARLEAARDRLEAALHDPSTPPRDLATVSRELRLLIQALSDGSSAGDRSALDEIAAARKKRGTA